MQIPCVGKHFSQGPKKLSIQKWKLKYKVSIKSFLAYHWNLKAKKNISGNLFGIEKGNKIFFWPSEKSGEENAALINCSI